jgi:hypothetical protein
MNFREHIAPLLRAYIVFSPKSTLSRAEKGKKEIKRAPQSEFFKVLFPDPFSKLVSIYMLSAFLASAN